MMELEESFYVVIIIEMEIVFGMSKPHQEFTIRRTHQLINPPTSITTSHINPSAQLIPLRELTKAFS